MTNQEDATQLDQLTLYLNRADVNSYFQIHPNQLTISSFSPPDHWKPWWDWAVDEEDLNSPTFLRKWEVIWLYYIRDNIPEWMSHISNEVEKLGLFRTVPQEVKEIIDTARRLAIPRSVFPETLHLTTISEQPNPRGMSPKKAHEVQRMTAYIAELIRRTAPSVSHVVDVGAGQAYLSRALRDELGLHVLALDWSEVQSHGAMRRDQTPTDKTSGGQNNISKGPSSGSLHYATVNITAESLAESVDKWILDWSHHDCEATSPTFPVGFVALHACGSLTLDIARTIIDHCRKVDRSSWKPGMALIVGCCYNLLRPEDRVLLDKKKLSLTANHLQLAAQVPSQWGFSQKKYEETKLSIRKIVWRALLEGLLERCDFARPGKRVGRMNDASYLDWTTFLTIAVRKLGCEKITMFATDFSEKEKENLTSRIEVFHVLRCILGPVVESRILLERKLWIGERLEGSGLRVDLVNLFQQESGSGRNIALVLSPEVSQFGSG
ncbi:hypothetical protein K474DRAFT_1771164 [Panus rudis PR-1116 ss-1]|nr:hypothetical protein K474DRAFT_1771164 [Panus rudis PR-1116 ss-1]